MKYSEIFYSLQGEGKLVGVTSVFFRTSYCNLRCWFCDAAYTSHHPENKDISITDAVDEILNYKCSHIVITGGEPMLQTNDLIALCAELKSAAYCHITIETNGCHYIADLKADFMSISPKLKSSTPTDDPVWSKRHERERINIRSLVKLIYNYDHQLKFVVDTAEDLEEIEALVNQLDQETDVCADDVVLMPQGVTREEIQSKQSYLARHCLQTGYRYSPRLHIDLWGNQRGT